MLVRFHCLRAVTVAQSMIWIDDCCPFIAIAIAVTRDVDVSVSFVVNNRCFGKSLSRHVVAIENSLAHSQEHHYRTISGDSVICSLLGTS